MKSLLLGCFALLFLVQTPLISALNCSAVDNGYYNYCTEINRASMSESEREATFSEIVNGIQHPYKYVPPEKLQPCIPSNDFIIKTDKLKYQPGEKIQVEIQPSNIFVNLDYANQIQKVKGSAILEAVAYENKISIKYECAEFQKIISVQENKLQSIWKFSIFGFLNYAFYIGIKKYFGSFI